MHASHFVPVKSVILLSKLFSVLSLSVFSIQMVLQTESLTGWLMFGTDAIADIRSKWPVILHTQEGF